MRYIQVNALLTVIPARLNDLCLLTSGTSVCPERSHEKRLFCLILGNPARCRLRLLITDLHV